MEELQILIKSLKRELEIANSCIPQCGIQKGFREEIEILEKAVEIYESYEESLREGCLI